MPREHKYIRKEPSKTRAGKYNYFYEDGSSSNPRSRSNQYGGVSGTNKNLMSDYINRNAQGPVYDPNWKPSMRSRANKAIRTAKSYATKGTQLAKSYASKGYQVAKKYANTALSYIKTAGRKALNIGKSFIAQLSIKRQGPGVYV